MCRSLLFIAALALLPGAALAQGAALAPLTPLTLRQSTVASQAQQFCETKKQTSRMLVLVCKNHELYEEHLAEFLRYDDQSLDSQSCSTQNDGQLRCLVFLSPPPFVWVFP